MFNSVKLLIFDKDDTITDTKSPLDNKMAEILNLISHKFKVAIISGSSWSVFNDQIINFLDPGTDLNNLYLLPASGSEFWYFENHQWREMYNQSFTNEEFHLIKTALVKSFDALPAGLKPAQVFSEQVENRGGQITFSALGQTAPKVHKKNWDPDMSKRRMMLASLSNDLSSYSVKIGGSTSVDVTKPGIDKSYGIKKVLSHLNIDAKNAVYIGDSFGEGGNDEVVKKITELKIVEVENHNETTKLLSKFLNNN